MSANERVKSIQVHRPIIYGSHARLLTEEEKLSAPAGHTHRWTVFLTSATTPPPNKAASSSTDPFSPEDIDYIPGGLDDLSYLIKKVTFRLHETYPNPNRVFDKPPFQVSETGWGEFTVQIRIQFVQESAEKPLTLNHPIKLHHWGALIEGPVIPSGSGANGSVSAVGTPIATGTPAAANGAENADAVKGEAMDTDTPAAAGTPAPKVEIGTPATPTAPNTPTDQIEVEPTQLSATLQSQPDIPQPISVASKYPVHSWQYDELIFSDPPRAFLDILNAHPPTPLPTRNRRPRDQRDEYDRKLKKKGRASMASAPVSNRNSRANTMESVPPSATGDTSAAAPPAVETPAPGQGVVVGIPGEPGSADVPLEFTVEMEKAEWNRLNDARIKIVEQMDKWRERLIAQEKELAKVKDEVKAVS